jgi:hypothetical protein
VLQEDGDPFAVFFEIGNDGGEIVEIGQQRTEITADVELLPGADAVAHIAVAVALGQEAHHQFARGGTIVVADTHGPEENPVLRECADVVAEAFPEKQKR